MAESPDSNCPFCQRIAAGDVEWTSPTGQVVAFTPLNPVTPGHLLVVPVRHVSDLGEAPVTSAVAMVSAAQLAADMPACNLITSRGADATQTVMHLHLHLVPRRPGDGLALPWTGQRPADGPSTS